MVFINFSHLISQLKCNHSGIFIIGICTLIFGHKNIGQAVPVQGLDIALDLFIIKDLIKITF